MDPLIAAAWSALAFLWPLFLIAAPIAFLIWAAMSGRRADVAALEKGKIEIEAGADAAPSAIGRGIDSGRMS